ncbi:MAG: DNA-formamidopyrimidine glycosylase [Candidatus Omnitrophica bacterium]|nr:DNA-formamidopyrimidine glycosylase [Candidatus Omnitrophota bacterium]MCF7893691.1 DNA-formamidopyrimidine glycosylase [Candidatus Omnitrophota bacterium]
MPELPEVETIKRELAENVLGEEITAVKINRVEVIKEPSWPQFKKEIIGQEVEKVIRRGKLLILKLKKEKFLVIHLRMTGWLHYGESQERARVIFNFSNGKALNYMDSRLLGHLRLRKNYKDLDFLKKLGPEIFQLTAEQFRQMVEPKKGNIKALIMNQNFIAGVGNIYAQEALFLAKIDPRRRANSLSGSEIKKLYQNLKAVLTEAVKYRGSSVDSYRDLSGEAGGMEKRLKVYGKKNEPCPVCKTFLKKVVVAGRGTCFCPRCQK